MIRISEHYEFERLESIHFIVTEICWKYTGQGWSRRPTKVNDSEIKSERSKFWEKILKSSMKRRKWPATFNLFDHLLWLWRNCIQILNTILTIVFEHDMIEFWCLAIIIDYLSHWFRIFSIFACINFTFFQGKPRIDIILYDVPMT